MRDNVWSMQDADLGEVFRQALGAAGPDEPKPILETVVASHAVKD